MSRHHLTHTSPRIEVFFLLASRHALLSPNYICCPLNACARIRTPTSTVRPRVSHSQNVSFSRRGHQKSGTKTCTNLALVGFSIFVMHRTHSGSIFRPWSAKIKMYRFTKRGHQTSGTKTCTNLALVGIFCFLMPWKHSVRTEDPRALLLWDKYGLFFRWLIARQVQKIYFCL